MLEVAPPELVRVASIAGFDAVLMRLNKSSDGRGHDYLADPAMRARTLAALDETGVIVWDTEVIRMRPGVPAASFEELFAASAQLKATYVLTTIEEPDAARASAQFAELAALAEQYGLMLSVEFMPFSSARTAAEARAVVEGSGAQNAVVLVDLLHLARSGGGPADVAALPARLVRYLQVCDSADGSAETDRAAYLAEAGGARLLPGQGVLPVREVIAAAPADVAVCVECPSPLVGELGAQAYADRAFAAVTELLAAVDAAPADTKGSSA